MASLRIESEAPGCVKLDREVRVIDGLDRVDLIDVLDKKAVREKESVHLGFAFNVPQGIMRMDIPWAVIRPEIDQMPAACKNHFSVGRWVDVSNEDYGVTWATLDAPLVEVGGMTFNKPTDEKAELPDYDPPGWLDKLEPSQTIYSWVMNNHWFTNYNAYQDGPTTFRYRLLPHRQYDRIGGPAVWDRKQPAAGGSAGPWRRASRRPFLELDTAGRDRRLDQAERGPQGMDCAALRRWRTCRESHLALGAKDANGRVDQQSGRGAGGRRWPGRSTCRPGDW